MPDREQCTGQKTERLDGSMRLPLMRRPRLPARILRSALRLAITRPHDLYAAGSHRVDLPLLAERMTSTQEFGLLEFHPIAGKIVGDRQYFFDGGFTTFPWRDENLHLLVEWRKGVTEPEEILPFLGRHSSIHSRITTGHKARTLSISRNALIRSV